MTRKGEGGTGSAGAREAARERLRNAFASDPRVPAEPPISLRAGDAIDSYDTPPPFDASLDVPTAEYIERHCLALHHLDAESWLHYLPILLDHALAQARRDSMAVDTLLFSLDARHAEYPVFPALRQDQRTAVRAALEALLAGADDLEGEAILHALEREWALHRG